jgi:hypothetical protein
MPMNQVMTATLVKYNTGSQGRVLGHVSKAIIPKSSVKVLRTTMSVMFAITVEGGPRK